MVVQRGEIWWASLADPAASEPGYRRLSTSIDVYRRLSLVVQAVAFNRSHLATVVVAAITSNSRLALAPGNVVLTRKQSGLPHDSVVNVSQLLTVDRSFLTELAGGVPPQKMREIGAGLARVL